MIILILHYSKVIMVPIETIKDRVLNNVEYYIDHHCFRETDKPEISIVMATNNRVEQTLFTLKTIQASRIKSVQVIIIDDSSPENFIPLELLDDFPYHIDYLTVKATRDWINPCVNYNIAFQFVRGDRVIIQNAEVCHVGDVLEHVKDNCTKGKYIVFDVAACKIPKDNRRLYNMQPFNYQNVASLVARRQFKWYQHFKEAARNYHFLAAIHTADLDELEGFDYDFAMDRCFDDNEFIYRITNVLKLKIEHPKALLGIHQHHERVTLGCTNEEYLQSTRRNKILYQRKIQHYKMLAEKKKRLV